MYYKNELAEPLSPKAQRIANELKEHKLCGRLASKWPNMETWDTKHIYELVFYDADMSCLKTLSLVKDIYDWDYPDAPMDLCFYKEGYCWLAITAHEKEAYLYTDSKDDVLELKKRGAKLYLDGEEENLFYCNLIQEMNMCKQEKKEK